MKWVRFKEEFDKDDKAPLKRFLKNKDYLEDDPVNRGGGPIIYRSHNHDPIIDNCFRIYEKPDDFKDLLYGGSAPKRSPLKYHRWDYHGVHYDNLPEEYLKELYFNEEYIDKIYGPGTYKSRPHPTCCDKPHPYEVFCGGWLHFYDEEVQHGKTDHAIYFDWDLRDKEKTVSIYLLQTKNITRWNLYVHADPPGSQDPPPVKGPPPPPC
jgi:hypothetical protein